MPNLVTFGATEYMDGALTLGVLTELLLRGRRVTLPRSRGRISMGALSSDADDDTERRSECKPLEAIDLCGCVSAVFVRALTDFVAQNLLREDGTTPDEEDARGRVGRHGARDEEDETPVATLYGLRRLGMRGVASVPPHILTPFVLACPRLTHLDLSGTRCGPELLDSLAESPSVKLVSLNLARCARLTGRSIVDFLCYGRSARTLTELCLYGDATLPSPLNASELETLVTEAPSFLSGTLQYLDLSSAPLTRALLDRFVHQPALRSLGLSHIPSLPLEDVAAFLLNKASNVEILTLIGTSPDLARGAKVSLALHKHIIRPLCTPPFRICSLSGSNAATAAEIPTRIRVIELSIATLNGLGAGAGAWRIVRSKGGRGFYVDSGSGWVASVGDNAEGGSVMRRDLNEEHPLRQEIERLANANGNVSSGVGWHARKMEVLYGTGMTGREDGLYGAVSFAYQG